jgi:methionyl-tRNA formyltransferase
VTVRIAFLGTPEVAVPALDALLAADDLDVAVVITNPDRPRGRSKQPVAPPVKVAAERANVPVWQPARPVQVLDDLNALELDACAVVAYGAILPASVLDATRHGFVNLHFSLLPRWRGAAPVQHALRAGDTTTGVTTFVLDPGMDTGPIIDRVEVAVDPAESSGELLDRLAHLGAPVLVESIRSLVGGAPPTPQPEAGVTLAPKITPDDVRIDWTGDVRTVTDLVRSADPAPGAHTTFRGERIKIYRVTPIVSSPDDAAGDVAGDPGQVVAVTKRVTVVACADGAVQLDAVQPMGKARMDGAAFVNGYRPELGERLGRDA